MTLQEQQADFNLRQKLGHLSELRKSADFQWFMAFCVAPRVRDAQDAALDIAKTPEEREKALQQYHALKEILEWPESEFRDAQGRLKT